MTSAWGHYRSIGNMVLKLYIILMIGLPLGCAGPESGSDASGDDKMGLTISAGDDPKTLVFKWKAPTAQEVDHYRLEIDPDQSSDFTVIDDADNINATSYQLAIAVHLPDWIFASYRVAAFDADGNRLITSNGISLSGTVGAEALIGYFKASNSEVDDNFGESIALSADGLTMAVGTIYEQSVGRGIDPNQNDNSASEAGAVYVFVCDSDGIWQQEAYIKASNTDEGDQFGYSVALSSDGSTLAVGALLEDSSAVNINGNQYNNSALDSGAVYLFTRNSASVWSQAAYVKASNTDAGDNFGCSVALSSDGSTLAVGAIGEAGNGSGLSPNPSDDSADSAGAVYIYTRGTNNAWSVQSYLKAENVDRGDQFGQSVALDADGNTLAVGADLESGSDTGVNGNENDNNASDSGAAYVFLRTNDNVWYQNAYLKASNTDSDDRFGQWVALSGDGDTLAVGAPQEDAAYIGTTNDESDNSTESAGAVYVFTRNSADLWSQEAYLKAENANVEDYFGTTLAISANGDILTVGAPYEDGTDTGVDGIDSDNSAEDTGAVYVFSRNASDVWNSESYLKSQNPDSLDLFGWRIALSSDGETLAVGAPGESGSASTINGNYTDNSAEGSGAAYLY